MSRRRYPALDLLASGLTLGELVHRMARTYGDRPALAFHGEGPVLSWSYTELLRQARAWAALLAERAIAPGARVALVGDNHPQWLAAFFGIVLHGGVVMPLDPASTPGELAHLLEHAGCQLVLGSERLVPVLAPACAPAQVLPLEAGGRYHVPVEPPGGSADELAALIYTSGATGAPKGVMLTHRNLVFDLEGCARVLGLYRDDVMLALLPLHHVYALSCTLFGLASGLPVVIPASLRPDRLVRVMQEARVTAIPAVPLVVDHLARGLQEGLAARPLWQQRLVAGLHAVASRLRPWFGARVARFLLRRVRSHLGPLRGMIVGGAALHEDSARFFYGLGVGLIHGYGLTEAAPVVSLTPRGWRPGDGVGLPLSGTEVRIDAPDERGVGEILVRGPHVMRGYHRDPEGTRLVLEDGWLRTGDTGSLDARGYLQVLGRSKDVIVLPSGKNVYPDELEDRYGHSPLFAELAVLAGRDPEGQECPVAVVVPSAEALRQAGEPTEARLRPLLQAEFTRMAQGFADHKRLRRFVVRLEPLPRTSSRKVRRHELAAGLSAED